MNYQKKVAVLIPVYNTIDYLPQSIESILNQTYKDLDIIIIDDHSTDGSYEYLLSLKDERIRLHRNKQNLGMDKTLNIGIDYSNAQYIVRQDCDDISHPERIAKQINYLDKNPNTHVLGTKSIQVNNGVKTTIYPIHSKGLFTFINCPVHHPTTTFRTSLVYKWNLRYASVAQDYYFWNCIFEKNDYHRFTFVTLDEVLVEYTIRNNQLSKVSKDAMHYSKKSNQSVWLEKFLNHNGWNTSLPKDWTVEDYNRFMQEWRDWEKPSGYSQQEYDLFMKYFAWNILFYHTKKKGIFETLYSYFKHGQYDMIGIARLIKQSIKMLN